VDDQPTQPAEFIREVAHRIGAPQPITLPRWLIRPFAPYYTAVAASTLPVANDTAKNVLDWRPAHPTYREGLSAWLPTSSNRSRARSTRPPVG
jgi:hypothetical protein